MTVQSSLRCGTSPKLLLVVVVQSWLSSCAVGGLCTVAFGCVLSRSVDGDALGLHTFCGVRSCSVDFVDGVSIARCGCELCLVGVVFVVTRCVGVTLLLNLVSPVQPSNHHFLSVVLVWEVVWCSLIVVLALSLAC